MSENFFQFRERSRVSASSFYIEGQIIADVPAVGRILITESFYPEAGVERWTKATPLMSWMPFL
jgi:hypothetical protein